MDWINLAQDTDIWQVIVTTVRILGFQEMQIISYVVEELSASERLSSMESVSQTAEPCVLISNIFP